MTRPYQAHDRRYHQRWHIHPSHNHVVHVHIPDDIVILTRDPSPCTYCGMREGCKHRRAA